MLKNGIKFLIFTFVLLLPSALRADSWDGQHPVNKFSLNFNPLGLIVGYVGLGVDFRLNERWTLGPSVGYLIRFRTANYDASAISLGARANFFITGDALNESGWYIGPEVDVAKMYFKDRDDGSKVDVPAIIISTLAGYHWYWDSGLNLGIGAGVRFAGLPDHVTYKSGPKDGQEEDISRASGAGLALEFGMGWSF